MYKVTFNEEPDGRFWKENRDGGEKSDVSGPHRFSKLPTALENEEFQSTSTKILKRKRETVTTSQKIQIRVIRVQTQTGQIIRITCEVCTMYIVLIYDFITCKGHDTVVSLSAGDDMRPAEAFILNP